MPIRYKVIKKKVSERFGSESAFYPIPQYRATINKRELAKRIARFSTLSTVDVYAALEALIHIIPELVKDGYSVKIEDFGSFKLTFKTEGNTDASKISKRNIKGNRLVFTPAKNLKAELRETKYVKSYTL